jgi:methylated-DNA-[protein]-cysteine S-methyltransferase
MRSHMDHVRRASLSQSGSFHVKTSLGVFGVQYSGKGLCRIEFPGACTVAAGKVPSQYQVFARQLQLYAQGKPVVWRVPLDFSSGTEFQRAVWNAMRNIPHGQTRSYGWLAERVKNPRAYRAVGSACGVNPLPVVVPCHRVVAGDGSLGGFSGGLNRKRRLLALEAGKRAAS